MTHLSKVASEAAPTVIPDLSPGSMALPEGEAHVWLAWTAACDTPALRAYYRSLLSREETGRLERFAFDHLKLEYLVTRALCRTVLSAYSNASPQDWRFRTNRYGRPEIDADDETPPLRFNLSNASGLVACAVTRTADIGIDVEATDRGGETEAIADRYFAPQELREFEALATEHRRRRFFELWTLKEAYLKASGVGLSLALDRISFALLGDAIGIAFASDVADSASDWQFALHDIGPRHLMALSVRRAQQPPFVTSIRETVPGPRS